MFHDLRWALRAIARDRAVAAIAIATIGLGIGLNSAMFSVMSGLLLRPLPYRDPGRLVTLTAEIPSMHISGANVEYNTHVEYWLARNSSFEAITAYSPVAMTLTSGGDATRIETFRVSAGFLSMLGVSPALGREFRPDEDRPGAPRVVILSDSLWRTRFGADSSIIGLAIRLEGNSYTVIGVTAPGFDLYSADAGAYVPIAAPSSRVRGMPSVGAYARLKPGVRLETAQAEMDALSRAWVADRRYPSDWRVRVTNLRDHYVRDVRSTIVGLCFAVGFVLLIACANVAHLLLTRSGAREREMAIRAAVGGTPRRIMRQLLIENSLLTAIGTALGLGAAWAASVALRVHDSPYLPLQSHIRMDAAVLLFAVAAAALTTLLFGFAPAIAAIRIDLCETLKEAGRGGSGVIRQSRLRAGLIVVEVALAVLLSVGAALTSASLARLRSVDPGFRPDDVLTAQLTLPAETYPQPAQRLAFFRSLADRIQNTPGVLSAGFVSHLPFSHSKSGGDVNPEGSSPRPDGERLIAFRRLVDPGYLATVRARLLRGRLIDAHDSEERPIAVINESMARRCWPGQDAVGKRFREESAGPLVTVVGVIADMRQSSLADAPDMETYRPYAETPAATMSLAVRTSADPRTAEPAIRAATRELDKNIALSRTMSLSKSVSDSTRSRVFSVTLFGVFALLALFLASVGIYGVVSYSVARRTREMGIRIALGAGVARIAAQVVGKTVLLASGGVVLGLAAALALSRLLKSMLYGISSTDPLTFMGVAITLVCVAAAAAYFPARRAGRVDPIEALRSE
jgi:putative ABC transport system permease protein